MIVDIILWLYAMGDLCFNLLFHVYKIVDGNIILDSDKLKQ